MIRRKERLSLEALTEKLVKKGKIQQAIDENLKILSGDERDIPIRNKLGELYIRTNQPDEAIREYRVISKHYEEIGEHSKSIAFLKKIIRLDPENYDSIKKMALLLHKKGFTSEAKREYSKLADHLVKKKNIKEAISVYKKLIEIDSEDLTHKVTLAELFSKEGSADQAIDILNEVAEVNIQKGALKEASKVLKQARALNKDHPRTLGNTLELLKKEKKTERARDLILNVLKKDGENISALTFLGTLHFDNSEYDKAEEVLSKVISIRPFEADARIKLGKIFIQKKNLDKAYEMFEPLVEMLIKRQKKDKAIGLLGFILASKKVHLPTVEKLASIYDENNDEENLGLAYRILLKEYRKTDLKDKSLSVLRELVNLDPENEEYYLEKEKLEKELGIRRESAEEIPGDVEEIGYEDVLEKGLRKVELYVDEGLIKNARRILDDLRLRFPKEPRVEKRFNELRDVQQEIRIEEISERLEKVREMERSIFGDTEERDQTGPALPEEDFVEAGKITSEEIFAGTDIIPLTTTKTAWKYFDLSKRINDELDAMNLIIEHQIRGDTTTFEKELLDIVMEFRKGLDEKMDEKDFETHYNLGIAFFEQGLFDEAILELELAAKNEALSVECFGVISLCYREKKMFKECLEWIDKALAVTEKRSGQWYSLRYDLGQIYEEMKEEKKALRIYNELKKWDSKYRDVITRVETLKKRIKK
jgi:tetratricopeptide (TPR) repeat protein